MIKNRNGGCEPYACHYWLIVVFYARSSDPATFNDDIPLHIRAKSTGMSTVMSHILAFDKTICHIVIDTLNLNDENTIKSSNFRLIYEKRFGFCFTLSGNSLENWNCNITENDIEPLAWIYLLHNTLHTQGRIWLRSSVEEFHVTVMNRDCHPLTNLWNNLTNHNIVFPCLC